MPTSPAFASPPLPQPLQMPPASRLYPQVVHHSSFKSSNGHHCCVVFLSWVCGSIAHSKTLARVRPLPVPIKSLEEIIMPREDAEPEAQRGPATCPGSHSYHMKARMDMKLVYPRFVFNTPYLLKLSGLLRTRHTDLSLSHYNVRSSQEGSDPP